VTAEKPNPDLTDVVGKFQARLRAFIRKRVNDDATAGDLTQEVWIRITRKLSQLRDPSAVEGWLYRIARNVIADHYRRQHPTEELPATLSAPAPESEREDLRECLHDYVRGVVETLPASHREVLLLTMDEGLTAPQLAEQLGITLTAAKSRIQRARAEVRKTMERCCHWKFDRLGNIIDYKARSNSCRNC
jgi:RNA polymerase sigma-70 factor (ECF subfamily)